MNVCRVDSPVHALKWADRTVRGWLFTSVRPRCCHDLGPPERPSDASYVCRLLLVLNATTSPASHDDVQKCFLNTKDCKVGTIHWPWLGYIAESKIVDVRFVVKPLPGKRCQLFVRPESGRGHEQENPKFKFWAVLSKSGHCTDCLGWLFMVSAPGSAFAFVGWDTWIHPQQNLGKFIDSVEG